MTIFGTKRSCKRPSWVLIVLWNPLAFAPSCSLQWSLIVPYCHGNLGGPERGIFWIPLVNQKCIKVLHDNCSSAGCTNSQSRVKLSITEPLEPSLIICNNSWLKKFWVTKLKFMWKSSCRIALHLHHCPNSKLSDIDTEVSRERILTPN